MELGAENTLFPLPKPQRVDRHADAKAIVDPWWQERQTSGNPVGQRYIACVKVVAIMLAQGVAASRVAWALRHAPVVSTGALEMVIQRELQRRGQRDDEPRLSRSRQNSDAFFARIQRERGF